MRKIAHISDLHFGTEDKVIAEGLLKDIEEKVPSIVVISGDLTQRARTSQFKAAKEYLDKIHFPKIVVPGNHDIPLFDVIRRFLFPLTRYYKYITEDLKPFYMDDEMAILGINTARSFTWKNGRISEEQIQTIKEKLCPIKMPLIEILVIHHQFIPSPDNDSVSLVGRAEKALDVIDECGIDLVLAGHLHEGFTGDVQTYHPGRRSIIVAQAGTAISNRRREDPNSYNFITLDDKIIDIEVRVWNGTSFEKSRTVSYKYVDKKWIKENL
ncbi:MAG: metallophosphoesterase [Bacteroidota bacterium]|nr:metallophosphoesterase [Bacteroidota bacterium]